MGPDLQWPGWLIAGVLGLGIGALVSDVRHVEAPIYRILAGFVFILAGVVGCAQGIVGFLKWALPG